MISICIPVYNYAVDGLVAELLEQIGRSSIQYEVFVAEDGSTNKQTLAKNKSISELVRYEVLEKNIGRSAIRKYLAQNATYDQLLFLDSDTRLVDANFLARYELLLGKYDVISGGVTYRTDMVVSKDKTFHYKYGSLREARLNKTESDNLTGFLTCNFLISKPLFLSLTFDENLTNYGHEDTFMLLQFIKRKIRTIGIKNPVFHNQLIDQERFILNQKLAVENLVYLYKKYRDQYDFTRVTLISAYEKITSHRLGLIALKRLSKTHSMFLPLVACTKSVFLLDLWKLHYFSFLVTVS